MAFISKEAAGKPTESISGSYKKEPTFRTKWGAVTVALRRCDIFAQYFRCEPKLPNKFQIKK